MYVVLDTNFIISVLKFRISVEDEIRRAVDSGFELAVLSGTLAELERLINKGKLFERKLAKLALQFIKEKKMTILPSQGSVDDVLAALPDKYVVATLDAELKKRLKAKGSGFVTIRQKKHLVLQ